MTVVMNKEYGAWILYTFLHLIVLYKNISPPEFAKAINSA